MRPTLLLLLALAAAAQLVVTAAVSDPASLDAADSAPPLASVDAALADDALYAAAEAMLAEEGVSEGEAVAADGASVPAFISTAPPLSAAPPSPSSAAASAEAVSTSAFTPVATFGTVPDLDTASASTFRGVDLAVDGDAVYLGLQEGARNWRGSVYRLDGASSTSPPRPVAGSPGFTPGPAVDMALAAAGGTLAIAYREGVYHHGYYRAGDDSWAYTSKGGGARFAQTGGPFTNARPRDLGVVLAPSTLTPVVAYADDEYELRATVRTLAKDGSWPTVGEQGFSAGATAGLRVAVDPAAPGSLYVAYMDGTCDGRATVKRFDGANWTDVGRSCVSPAKAAGLAVAIVPGNASTSSPSSPCLAYGGYDGGVVVCYADGDWRLVGGAPFSSTRTNATSLAYDPARASLLVSFRDSGYGGRVSVSRVDARGWAVVGARGFSDDAVWRPRLGVTARGATYVAYEIGGGADATDRVVVEKMKG